MLKGGSYFQPSFPIILFINLIFYFFRLSQTPIARNSSISSAQLNAIAPLVRVTRIPSTRFDTITEYQVEQQSTIFKATSIRSSIKSKAKEIFSKPTTPKSQSKKSNSVISGDLTKVQSEVSVKPVSVKSEYSSTSRSSTSSVVLVNQRSKSLFVQTGDKVHVDQRHSAVNPKFLARSNAFLKPKGSDEFIDSSKASNRYRGISVPNPNTSSNRSTKVGEQLLGPLVKIR